MKYFTRAKLYKASNVKFDAENIRAYSYDWWEFVRVYNGKVLFNNYAYSNSTRRHQWKVRHLMQELGIKIDVMLETPASLSASDAIKQAIKLLDSRNQALITKIETPRTRKSTNIERYAAISANKKKIKELRKLATGFYTIVEAKS